MIKKVKTDDIPSLVRLQRSIEKENTIWGYCADSTEDWAKRNLAWTLLAIFEDKPVGFIHCLPRPYSGECVFPGDSRILEIVDLIVAKPYRCRGLGRELVAAIQAQAREEGFTHLRVYSAAKRFDDIREFYHRCGFTPWYLEMTQEIRAEQVAAAEAEKTELHSEYFDTNRANWDEVTDIHLAGSDCYPIDDFKKGKCALRALEIEEVGNVSGKSMLHLQCHFGMDTLSWARRGARVTGVDFSEKAIEAARSLSREINVDARFICCNVYDLPEHLTGTFDIVYASYGVHYWLPDLRRWAEIISHFLKDGGFFYIADGHPISDNMGERLEGDYFATNQAVFSEPGYFDYANTDIKQTVPEYGWRHTVSDIINSLIGAGLRVDFFNEFPSFDVEQSRDGEWQAVGSPCRYPKMFSMKATKDRQQSISSDRK